jgi:hypothetical protein
MRALRWFGVAVIAVVVLWCTASWALTAWIAHRKNYEARSMHEAHMIADEIKAQDPSINAYWTTDDRALPDVVIRDVSDRAKQDEILAWAKALKNTGRVERHITINFQTAHSNMPDEILRSEGF